MRLHNLFRYEAFIIVGLLMVIFTLVKLLGFYKIDSDWFWFIAGLGLIVEGIISLTKQKTFSNKYKILTKEEYVQLVNEKL